MTDEKVYLGDGLYAEWDGYQIKLTAENGVSTTDEVYLDRETFEVLKRFAYGKLTKE